jgi:8-oxo-dGTP pyrophosphatase MutT (NUDIX family)
VERVERHSARVVFIDQDDRALLQLVLDESRGSTFWLTTGGGIDNGESVIDAVIREAREEAGYVLEPDALGPPVVLIDGEWSFRGVRYAGVDTIFFVRVESFTVDSSGQDEIERAIIQQWRWWTLGELASTNERIEPAELPVLLAQFIAGDLPPLPIRLSSFTPHLPAESANQSK